MNASHRKNEWDDDDDEEGPDGDDDFDYDEFVQEEFGGEQSNRKFSPMIRITAVFLLVLFVLLVFLQIGF